MNSSNLFNGYPLNTNVEVMLFSLFLLSVATAQPNSEDHSEREWSG